MHKPQNVAYLRAGIAELLRAIHDKVGAPAFLGVRHLFGEKRGELVLGHPRAAEDALALQIGRRRHHDDGVAEPLASGLEQERHVEDDDGCVAGLRLGEERVPRRRDQRMHDGLEPAERCVIPEHHRGELAAIDLAAVGRPGERALDQRDCFALIELMHHGVGIVDRHSRLGKELCRRRFAHAEGAGQAQDEGAMAHASRHPRRRRKSSAERSGRPRMVK